MLHASTKKLIDRLAEMTELAKLDWTEGENGQITYSTEGYSVALTESPNEMVITSKDGKELERAGAEDLAASQNEDGTSYTDILAAMTNEATRVARGTEAAISTLLAGMQDTPEEATETDVALAETDEADETADMAASSELMEDVGDETEVLSDESVEAVAAATEDAPEEAEAQTETADPIEVEPETDTEIAVAADTETDDTDMTDTVTEDVQSEDDDSVAVAAAEMSSEDETEAEETHTADETEVEAVAVAESENEVTEAVARLADEVNQREDSTLDAAAASAVGAVAMAAGLTAVTDDHEEAGSEVTEVASEAETETELAPETETETASVEATPLTAQSEPEPYVPFGLETAAEPASAPADVSEETEAPHAETAASTEDKAEESSVVFGAFSTPSEPEASDTETAPEPVTAEAETDVEPESDTPVAAWATTPQAEPEIEENTLEAANPVAAFETTETSASFKTEEEDVSETEEAVAADTFVAAPVTDIAPEPATTEPAAAPQTYSLSGIGAGFGLGALSAKTEATGIPGPSATGAGEDDKVVIDATEDVLPEIDGKPALPPTAAPLTTVGAANGGDTAQSKNVEPEGDTDILKPRTRFNPWD